MKAIVIGAGHSLLKNLDILKKIKKISEQEDVLIFVCDRMLRMVLAHDIKPNKIIAVTTEGPLSNNMKPANLSKRETNWNYPPQFGQIITERFYSISREQAQDIKVHISCQATEHMKMFLEWRGFKIGKSFHRNNMICQRKIEDDAENFIEGYNVGVACIWVAARIYKCLEIFTVGIDLTVSPDMYGYNWDGELDNSMIGMIRLRNFGVNVYNCNPNGEGRFYAPVEKSNLDLHFK